MTDYKWAGNPLKLQRVIGENPHGTEEQHLEAYRKTLGVVAESEVPKVEEKKEEVKEDKPKKKKK